MNQEDIRTLNELKILSIDMISRAGSGSPGLALSMAPSVYAVFARHLCVRPNEPEWMNRDRIVLSSGNVSSLFYAAYYLAGYAITKEDLMNYRTIGSSTPGTLEYGTTPGVDISSGLYGEGIGNAVGIATARRYMESVIKSQDDRLKPLDYEVYCFCTDRDFMEGIADEALSFAGTQKLDHLIFLFHYNNMTTDGSLTDVMNIDFVKKYQAMGFYVDYLSDGSNVKNIDKAISSAKRSGKPAILILKTILGKESFSENKSITYNRPLTVDDVANLRKKWNLFLPPFEISKDSLIFMQKNIQERTDKKYKKWKETYSKVTSSLNPKIKEVAMAIEKKGPNIPFDSSHYKINDGYRESLKETNSKILNLVANYSTLFLGGSADNMSSCQTYINQSSNMTAKNPSGRNISFGLREHAMGAMLNGMAISGLRVYGSTKLVYADYLKPAIRNTALMNLPVTYIFTHDTISVGEDGPLWQPVEQLSMLHSIPNVTLYRPGDILEVMGAWECIMAKQKPSVLVITQNDTPKLPGSNAKLVSKGAYIIKQEKNKLDGILISSGSELLYALQIAYELEQKGTDLRVVSMPSMELFLSEGKEYEKTLLPENAKKIVIEAGSTLYLNRFATSDDYIIGIDDFGYSGKPLEVAAKMGFDYENLKIKVENLLK